MKKTTKKKRRAYVEEKHCVACGCCARVCPVSAITIWHGIMARIGESCLGCGKCAAECPASIIEIREVEK